MAEFKPYGKTPRLNRDIIVTEKIDGTNAAIHIERIQGPAESGAEFAQSTIAQIHHGPGDIEYFAVTAQSRNRIITPNGDGKTTDNHGFAAWVFDNADVLAQVLGEGIHYGEWYGKGIQHGYGLADKRFALFAVDRYDQDALFDARLDGVEVETVPVLYRGRFSEQAIRDCVDALAVNGSRVVSPGIGFGKLPGPPKAEGVVIFHTASRQVYKVLCENDEIPKSLAEAA